ncbi:SPOR domain-containing protein [Methylobacterium oryzisoli]|uniref:SPOR domain-containing protein n=1 Tax=Methylobacterium oryzisoli TaxID=3385502 RepID=UPI003891451C
MTTNASRIPVDDGFEPARQPLSARPGLGAAKGDPLAELARIVGQDDPFRALLAAKESRRPAGEGAAARVEPTVPSYGPEAEPAPPGTPADAFNQYLAAVQREAVLEPEAPAAAEEPAPEPAPERPRGRRQLMLVGSGLAVVAVAVGGALTWRALHPARIAGTPIVVMADQAPLKIAPAPQAAGGVEFPDQNKQIYERNAKDGQIRIVNREEQPLDVKQAARALVNEAATAATPVPGAPVNMLTESLGEPRRVRTVSVKPEPPPFEAQRAAQGTQGGPAASAVPTMTLPEAAPAPATPRAATRSLQAATATPAPEPQAAETVSSTKPAVQRVASAEVVPVRPVAVPAQPPAPSADTQAPVGGYSVQLSVRATEKEARAAFVQAQERYRAELSGQSPLIRQAEVNGKTIFRVRVGPMSKESANGLCGKLQAAGGPCFVAKN